MQKKAKKTNASIASIAALLHQDELSLLKAKGADLVANIGKSATIDVLYNVFCGRNLRDSTEFLTRRRISALNLAIAKLYIEGLAADPAFAKSLPNTAHEKLKSGGLTKDEKWIYQWILGLTDKSATNVLRNSETALNIYVEKYNEINNEIAGNAEKRHGRLDATIQVGTNTAELDWADVALLLNTTGTQTLAIRGSDESAYGKLFEKLVLGTLLTLLGFEYVKHETARTKAFWLSTRHAKRESDATLIYEKGQGIRFDIGFIGKGNSEITLDKVSRFERQATIAGTKVYMATIIIVDAIGTNSKVRELAKEAKGEIVQMSASYWIREVIQMIKKAAPSFKHELLRSSDAEIDAYLKANLPKIDVFSFLSDADISGSFGDTETEGDADED
jgi:hypothetical protein